MPRLIPARTFTLAAIIAAVITIGSFSTAARAGDELLVVSTSPAARTLTASQDAAISVTFDRPVDRDTFTHRSFWAFGRWSGAADGPFVFSNNDHTVSIHPERRLSAGEQVMVILSHDLRAADGSPLRSAGYSFQFWVRARGAPLVFSESQRLTTRTIPNQSSRAYGAIATDLDNDSHLDITVVNEDSADLRVFMNRADNTGKFDTFLQPTFPVNDRASPNEPSDFNRDGFADIAVANINTATVSILLGNGDGTFAPQQEITVGSLPRGLAVLDADGDGDADIVNTNYASNNVSLLLNNGNGVFGAPIFFEGGSNGEWALAAADMDEDGILDLVIGARDAQRVAITRCNGNATFTPLFNRPCGGAVWMLNAADLNADGHEDVITVNSAQNNGGVLTGDGNGGLSPVTTLSTDAFPLATDIGDVDGDGDLDWITSSFSGDWRLYLNNGNAAFTFNREFNAPRAASCALFFDANNDGDLDLGLIDEIEDVVIIMHSNCPGDWDENGVVNAADVGSFLTDYFNDLLKGTLRTDVDGSGVVNAADVGAFLTIYFSNISLCAG